MGGFWRVVAFVVAGALTAAACSGGGGEERDRQAGDREASLEPVGDLLAEVDGVGEVRSGTVRDADELEVTAEAAESPAPADELGALAVGTGLDITVDGAPDGLLEVRLDLPERPDDADALPGVFHVRDDGSMVVETGLWDEDAGQVAVWVDEFSVRVPAWLKPEALLNGVAQAGRAVQGAYDAVADWATGRTDPPPCDSANAPGWASLATNELASVHVCLQDPPEDPDGRAELLIKSNRNTAQLLTVPAGADYVWVDGQADDDRAAYAELFNVFGIDGVDGASHVLLPGGGTMSLGFRQPEISTEVDVLAYRTWTMVIGNSVLALIGHAGVGHEGTLGVLASVQSCIDGVSGVDATALDVAPSGFDSAVDFAGAMAVCTFELLQDSSTAAATIETALQSAGMPASARGALVDRLRPGLQKLAPTARGLAKALAVVGVTANAWDNVFDTLADGRVTVSMTGRSGPGLTAVALRSAPVPALCDNPAGTMSDGLFAPDGGVGATGATGIVEAPRFEADGWGSVAVGDLTGDGRPEGALVLYCHWGGSGSDSRAVVYTDGPTVLGDVPIDGAAGLRIEAGALDVAGLTHDGEDANCCPSVLEARRFRIDGDQIVEAEREVASPSQPITEGAWGPLRMGSSYVEAAFALAVPLDVTDSIGGSNIDFTATGPSCVDATTVEDEPISILGSSNRTGVIYVQDEQAKTETGVGVGSTVADVREAYGDRVREEDNIYQDQPDLYVGGDPATDGSPGVRFVPDDQGVIYLVMVGVQPYLGLPEGCA